MATTIKVQTIEAQKNNVVLPVPFQPKSWRVEIDEFLADTRMTNLFLLTLEQMQNDGLGTLDDKGNVNWWTFYNLSGIHNFPQEDWNNVKGRLPREYREKDGPMYDGSYCRHGSIVFPTWHRAYVYQFEVAIIQQAVQNQMRTIADQFPVADNRAKYQTAAARFRLPFWDPFMPRNEVPKPQDGKVDTSIWGLPKILSQPKVHVRRPKNPKELIEMDNPLHHFTFPAEKDYENAKGRKKIDWNRSGLKPVADPETGRIFTVRSPRSDGVTSLEDLNGKIQAQAQNSATKVWHMLNPDVEGSGNYLDLKLDPKDPLYNKKMQMSDKDRNRLRTWESFSNHIKSRSPVVSVESWHDDIHFLVGGGTGWAGQMNSPQVAGFDPIFWLHHCNIDRIFALFQALYPDTWVAKDGEVNVASELYPFFKDTKNFYNSNDLRDWKKLGFAMPGSNDLNEESREIIKEYVRDNYYWATDGAYPPESLKYPINLSNVEALYGKDAGKVAAPKVTFDAIEVTHVAGQAPAARLVQKVVALSGDEEVVTIPKDTAATAAAQIENEKSLPEGALQDVEAPTPTKMVTWNAHLKIKKHAFDGSFGIHFFIGDVNNQKSNAFMTRGNEVGFSGVFTSNVAAECANCDAQRAADIMYEDVIPITLTLVDYLEANPKSDGLIRAGDLKTIPNLEPESVVPFLKEHLRWRVVDPESNLIDEVQQIKDSGLEVKVVQRIFETPNDANKLGVYSDPVLYQEITELKLGGFGYQE